MGSNPIAIDKLLVYFFLIIDFIVMVKTFDVIVNKEIILFYFYT